MMSKNNELNENKSTPTLFVSKWFNSNSDITLESLRGKVVAIHAFQMLCPGCVLHGIPQAKKFYELFNNEHVAMELFQMRGTPTWLLFDRLGQLRKHVFGQVDDLVLSSEITQLAMELSDSNLEGEMLGGEKLRNPMKLLNSRYGSR